MKKKVLTFLFLIGLVLNLSIIFDKVCAEEDSFSIYIDPLGIGPIYNNTDVGDTDCIGISADTSCIYHLKLVVDNEEIVEFDANDLYVESSDERILGVSLHSKSIELAGVSEGVASVNISFYSDGTLHSLGRSWRVNPAEPVEVDNVYTYVFLNKSDLLMNAGDSDEVSIYFDLYGSTAVTYPDGYTEANYYEYAWESLDDSIVRIVDGEDSGSVSFKALKEGKTTLKCTITSVDNLMTPVEKIVKVEVVDRMKDLYGHYEWKDSSNEKITRLYLKLNDNGTAEFIQTSGNTTESTSGTYEYADGKIFYTKVNYNDEEKTEYTGNYKVVTFNIVDGKLKVLIGDDTYTLSKLSKSDLDNPKTGLNEESITFFTILTLFALFALIKKYTKFPKHN